MTAMPRDVPYPAPGEILLEEFLKPMGITQYRLAKELGVSQRRIGEIVTGKRAVTADTGLRLSRFFGVSEGFWTGLQDDHDRALAKDTLAETLARITPWQEPAADPQGLVRPQGPVARATAARDHRRFPRPKG